MLLAVVVFFSGIWMFGEIDFIPTAIDMIAEQTPSKVGIFDKQANATLFGGPIPVLSLTWLAIMFILLPHLLNRVLTVQSEDELKEFVLASSVGLFFMSAFMQWVGLYALALQPGLEFPDAAVPVYVSLAFPNVIGIIITVSLINAILTTTDSILQGVGSVIGNDVYKYSIEGYLLDNVSIEQLEEGETSTKIERRSVWASCIGVFLVALVGLLIDTHGLQV